MIATFYVVGTVQRMMSMCTRTKIAIIDAAAAVDGTESLIPVRKLLWEMAATVGGGGE